MKELLAKSFWRGVKKTFYTALEGPPAEDKASQPPAVDNPKDAPKPEIPSKPSTNSKAI